MSLTAAAYVFVGAGCGGVIRWLVGLAVSGLTLAMPLGTTAVNLAGCLLIGIIGGWLESKAHAPTELRLFLITGFLGGFTTFSAYSLETAAQLQHRTGLGLVLLFVKPALCVGLTLAGLALARRLW